MKILVTGGAGFIGSHLIDLLLKKGHQVTCVDNLYLGRMSNIAHNLKDKKFTFVKLDVLDTKKLDALFKKGKFQTVFHLVANSDIKQSAADTQLDLRLNFLTTYNVLEAMRKYAVKDIVFASTSAIFGETKKVITEDMGPLVPISFYGASKLAAESYISVYVNNYGFRGWIIRFPNVTGERGTHGILFDFMKKLQKNDKVLEVLGNGRQEKPYLYVRELVEGIYFVWKNAKGAINQYNLGTNTTIKVSRIAELLLEELEFNQTKIQYTGGDRGWVGDVPKFRYSVEKVRKLGWKGNRSSEQAIRFAIRNLKHEFGFK